MNGDPAENGAPLENKALLENESVAPEEQQEPKQRSHDEQSERNGQQRSGESGEPLETADSSYLAGSGIEHQYRRFRGRRELGGRLRIIWNMTMANCGRTVKHPIILGVMILAWLAVAVLILIIAVAMMYDAFPSDEDGNLEGELFLMFYIMFAQIVMVFVAMLGGMLITDDRSDNLLPLYFSRPMSRFDYLLGKFLAMTIYMSTVTTIPLTVMFFIAAGLANEDFDWFKDQLWLLAAIWLHGLLVIVMFAMISTAFSSLTKKKGWAMAATIFALFFTQPIAEATVQLTRNDYGYMLAPSFSLLSAGSGIYNEGVYLGVEWYYALASVALVNAISLGVIVWQLVVKEGNQ